MDKLTEVMSLLINEEPLLPKHKNHPLHGNYKNWWECHIEPDWLLILFYGVSSFYVLQLSILTKNQGKNTKQILHVTLSLPGLITIKK